MNRKEFVDYRGTQKWNTVLVLLFLLGILAMFLALFLGISYSIEEVSLENFIVVSLFGIFFPICFIVIFFYQALLLLFEVKSISFEDIIIVKRLLLSEVHVPIGRMRYIHVKVFDFSNKNSLGKIDAIFLYRPAFLVITSRVQQYEEFENLIQLIGADSIDN